jgi:hypothetical protein
MKVNDANPQLSVRPAGQHDDPDRFYAVVLGRQHLHGARDRHANRTGLHDAERSVHGVGRDQRGGSHRQCDD